MFHSTNVQMKNDVDKLINNHKNSLSHKQCCCNVLKYANKLYNEGYKSLIFSESKHKQYSFLSTIYKDEDRFCIFRDYGKKGEMDVIFFPNSLVKDMSGEIIVSFSQVVYNV